MQIEFLIGNKFSEFLSSVSMWILIGRFPRQLSALNVEFIIELLFIIVCMLSVQNTGGTYL